MEFDNQTSFAVIWLGTGITCIQPSSLIPARHVVVNLAQKLPVLYFFKYLGMDRIVRLWNPYVPQKPTAFLRGHNSPIAFIAIAGEDNRLFSISIDKCVKVLYDC